MKSSESKKSISNLENQKVDADKVKGGGKGSFQDQGWENAKNKFQGKAEREDAYDPAGEKYREMGKRAGLK